MGTQRPFGSGWWRARGGPLSGAVWRLLWLLPWLSGCSSTPFGLLREASGAASQTVCSGVFVSHLPADEVYRLALRPEPGMGLVDWALRYEVDRPARAVRTTIAGGFETRSAFHAGRGCTLQIRDDETQGGQQQSAEEPKDLIARTPEPAALDIAGPDAVPPSAPALQAAIARAFGATPREAADLATQAVVVIHRGRLVAEHYAPGIGVDTQLDGHSMAKSVVNALLGVLARAGRLDIREPVHAPEWPAQDARASITIEQLMRMEAGFDFDEGAGASTASHIWYTEPDVAHAAARQPLVTAPGTLWHYSSGSYAILSRVLRERIGGPQALSDFAHRALFDPLGMGHVTIEFDSTGTMMGAHAVYASARDWARFGLLYLHDGMAGGERVLPAGWVRAAGTPTRGGGYGAGFWLNQTHEPVPTWRFPWGLPGVPADAIMARGYLGQWTVIVPSRDLVVVRMGFTHEDAGAMGSTARLIRDVVAALQ